MKTLLILLMPVLMVIAFMTSSHFFAVADYYMSAVFTLAALCSATLWIAALSSKQSVLY